LVTDVLILNTAVLDLRSRDFVFAKSLAGPVGLAKCDTKKMPEYTQAEILQLIGQGFATGGGCGNTAPLIARAGLNVTMGVNLGRGEYNGLDIQGRTFYEIMTDNGVDMSETFIHPELPTGTTFIYESGEDERSGIAYFLNANNDFDFEYFKGSVERLRPKVVYYLYSGLSDRGDANEGRDLADFICWCRKNGCITIVDSHTLTGNPEELIRKGIPVESYKLLIPLLPELDIFFTSSDEARMIENTLGRQHYREDPEEEDNNRHFLEFMTNRFWQKEAHTRIYRNIKVMK
jgi:sugar/nucleoside kinase (ribokinase family)